MCRNSVCTILLILLVVGFTARGFGFDGKRQGFILGGGVGAGFTSYTGTVDYLGMQLTSDRETDFSFITNFVIGGGVSKSLLLYYMNRVSWFSTGDEIAIFGLTGLGLTYYLQPKAPSPLLKAGVGFSSFLAPFEPEYEDYWGFGFSLGAGYEISPHWSIEADLVMGWPSYDELGASLTLNTFSIQIGFNGIAY